MKKGKNHLGFLVTTLSVMLVFIVALSAFGYIVERDIVSITENRAEVFVGPHSGRVAGVAVEEATLVIDRGHGNTLSVSTTVTENMSVFDVLQKAANDYKLGLRTKQYDFGVLIEGIGELIGGQDDMYWLYYINGESPFNAVDQQPVSAGDIIEFKFEKSTF